MNARLLFIVLAAFHDGTVDRERENIPIALDANIQSRIEYSVTVAIKPGATALERITEVEKQLRKLREQNPEKLVQQVLYCYCQNMGDDNEKRALTSLLIHYGNKERD